MIGSQIKKCHTNCIGKQMAKTLIKESNDELIDDILLSMYESDKFSTQMEKAFRDIIIEVMNKSNRRYK